jgi:hypothetical protein
VAAAVGRSRCRQAWIGIWRTWASAVRKLNQRIMQTQAGLSRGQVPDWEQFPAHARAPAKGGVKSRHRLAALLPAKALRAEYHLSIAVTRS